MQKSGLVRLAVVFAVVFAMAAARGWADETHRGEVKRVGDGSFTMSAGGETHSHTINSETKIWIDGEPANLSQLRAGDQVKVTTDDNSTRATKVEATRGESNRTSTSTTRTETTRESSESRSANQTRRGGLGVTVVGTRDEDGVYVQDVVPNSPAAKAGIRRGDYILSADDEDTDSPEDLSHAVRSNRPGASIELRLWRDGERFTKQVNLAALADVFEEEARAERRQERAEDRSERTAERDAERSDRFAERSDRNSERSDRFADRSDRRRFSANESTDNARARGESRADYNEDSSARHYGERTGHSARAGQAFDSAYADDIQRLERSVQQLSEQVNKMQQRLDRMARENGDAELQR